MEGVVGEGREKEAEEKTDSGRGSQPEANPDFCVSEAHISPPPWK